MTCNWIWSSVSRRMKNITLSKTFDAVIVLLPLTLVAIAVLSCSATEGTGDTPSSDNGATTAEVASSDLSPDPAFDPLLGTLQQMTTAPIMLPATLPPELKNVAIANDVKADDSTLNDDTPQTTRGDKYTIMFLTEDAKQIVQQYSHASVSGTLMAEPTSTPLVDFTLAGAKVVDLGNVTLPDGTVADLKRVEPPEGTNGVPFSLGMFEKGSERYTLRIEFIDSPSGHLARQTLSTMVEVPRT
jgi:hypothetical protein